MTCEPPSVGTRFLLAEEMPIHEDYFASGEAIVRYEPAPPMTGTAGDIEALSMWAGQGVALMSQARPAADIVAELTSRL